MIEVVLEAVIMDNNVSQNDSFLLIVLQQLFAFLKKSVGNDFVDYIRKVGIMETMNELHGRFSTEPTLLQKLNIILEYIK